MTILANTKAFLAEFENGVLTITRRSNGLHIAFQGERVAGEFRDCLKTHDADTVCETYGRIWGFGRGWLPCLYKQGRIPAPPVPKPEPRDWSGFVGLEVAPCREIGFGKARRSEVCLPSAAEFFTIYGREKSGMAVALEDEKAADDIAAMLAGCIEASGLKVCYFDASDFAPSQRYGTMSEMCDSMAELIARDMPDTDDLEAFAEAMEAHPLDPYREAFADACHHNGRDDLRGAC